MKSHRSRLITCLVYLASALPFAAHAAAYPERPITVVVPFAAGGATDAMARPLSREASAVLGQTINVDNRSGAAGAIGALAVVRAKPDGYTVCFCGGGPLVLLKLLDDKLAYDPARDLVPVTLTHMVDFVVGVAPNSPIRSMRDLVAAAKASPGTLTYASTGLGGPAHLGQEYFDQLAGIEITHVPYKGESQFVTDLATGRLSIGLFSAQLADQMARGGQTRLIGSWSAQRLKLLPGVPTVAEQGFPGFSASTFVGVTVPRGTARDIVDTLNAAFVKAVRHPDVAAKMTGMGFTPVGNSPQEFADFLRREEAKWSKVVERLGPRARE